MFQRDAPRPSSASARSRVSGSPPQSIFRFAWPLQPESIRSRQVVGVAWSTVACDRKSSSESRLPSDAASGPASAVRAPTVRGRRSSRVAMSKETVVTASSVSVAVQSGTLSHRFEQVHERAMADRDALRPPGRSRGVDDVGEVVGGRRGPPGCPALPRRSLRARRRGRGPAAPSGADEAFVDHQQSRSGILEDRRRCDPSGASDRAARTLRRP